MKIYIRKKAFSPFLLFTLIVMSSLNALAQIKKEKRVDKTFTGKEVVRLTHGHGPLQVLKSKNNELKLEVVMSLEDKTEADAQLALNNFNVDFDDIGNRLSVETQTNINNWITNNGISKLTFSNGDKVKDIKNVKATMVVYVPKLKELYVANKYDEIIIEDGLDGSLEIKLYSGRIDAGNINGNLSLEMKYSKGKIGNFQEGDFNLYDCDLKIGSGKKVEVESKYSEIELGDLDEIEMEIYDDKYEIGNIKGKLLLQDKYSDLKIGNFSNARMDVYDSDITLKEGQDIQAKSKYTKFRIDKVKSLNFDLSYDDNVWIEHLESLVTESKYSEYDIVNLKSSVVMNSYDDDLKVTHFVGPLKSIGIEGKYTKVSLKLPTNTEFRLDATTTYGNFSFPKERFEIEWENIGSTKRELRGKTKNASADSPLIQLDLYDCDVDLD